LSLPSAITAYATSAAGAPVTFTASATDAVDPLPSVVCAPSSGAVFPFGTTTVTCTARDGSGNQASGGFTVEIRARPGDIDRDGDVDLNDLNIVLVARNTPASGPDDSRDLNHDGTIDALDARILTTLCTRPRCATQ
jgi:hypothetical protein